MSHAPSTFRSKLEVNGKNWPWFTSRSGSPTDSPTESGRWTGHHRSPGSRCHDRRFRSVQEVAMNQLRVHLLGKLSARHPDNSAVQFHSQKEEELFCYLLVNRGRFCPREQLASLLW